MASPKKRLQILRAVEALFTRRQAHEITLEDVARRAGVGKGTLYRYFKDKDDLLFQTASSGFEELHDLLARRVLPKAPFERQLLTACRNVCAFHQKRRQLSRMMQSEQARPCGLHGDLRIRWMEQRKKLLSGMVAMIRQGVREGLIRRDVRADVLASVLLGMLWAWSRDVADGPEGGYRMKLLVDLFRRGAGRNPPRSAGRMATARG